MSAVVVVGAQWGDEGKGKVVDLYAPFSDLVVRYAGGANAGHTLVIKGEKIILKLLPSGILHKDKTCIIAQGTVIDPNVLWGEIEALESRGVIVQDRLSISDQAHVVLPSHKLVDEIQEKHLAIGTTKRGIGPAYQDKVARRGIRIGDLIRQDTLQDKIKIHLEGWLPYFEKANVSMPTIDEIYTSYALLGERLAPMIRNTGRIIYDAQRSQKNILFEGAQGTMLDIDHGTYPYVTSSSSIAGGACTGTGIGPTTINKVIGISKAYATRVGGGPFPTELHGAEGDEIRKAGGEFGSVTGRPRRCGWIDIPALRLAVRVNGIHEIALTKLDVLTGRKEVRLAVAYDFQGDHIDEPPFDDLEKVKPVYETMPGWDEPLHKCRKRSDLPLSAQKYIHRIEEQVGCSIGLVSVGADRDDTADLSNPFL